MCQCQGGVRVFFLRSCGKKGSCMRKVSISVRAVGGIVFFDIPCLTNQGLKCLLHYFLLTNQSIVSVRGWIVIATVVYA